MKPDFDELIDDVSGAERARLLRVHELLLEAGPPAELSPDLEAGPTLAMTMPRRRGRPAAMRRKAMLIAATVAVLAVAFLFGYVTGNHGGTIGAERTLRLTGTTAAPAALASLQILPVDTSGNWPMRLSATGLPTLGPKEYYEVFLVRRGKVYAPCGSFLMTHRNGAVSVTLNAPYRLRKHDTWIVTVQHQGDHEPGAVVLRPTAQT